MPMASMKRLCLWSNRLGEYLPRLFLCLFFGQSADRPYRKRKNEDEQAPDAFRLRDAEGNSAICHGCLKGSLGNRFIIPCSLCGIFWHLDCLDPPLANPPVLRTWKCPLHVEDLLKAPGAIASAHRFRKIKNAPVIKPVFSRGYVNNGYIEVDPEESASEEEETGWRDVATYGRMVRLPEKGIKLDFISRYAHPVFCSMGTCQLTCFIFSARENRKGKTIPSLNVAAPVVAQMGQRSLEEQQAALNLAKLSSDGCADGVTTLIDAMVVGLPLSPLSDIHTNRLAVASRSVPD